MMSVSLTFNMRNVDDITKVNNGFKKFLNKKGSSLSREILMVL